jgi:hypothetical protein
MMFTRKRRNRLADVIELVLEDAHTPLAAAEIANTIFRNALNKPTRRDPSTSIADAINRHIAQGNSLGFVKTPGRPLRYWLGRKGPPPAGSPA